MQTEADSFRISATVPRADESPDSDWVIALAGGEGLRLQDYVRRRFGGNIPKQYCPLLGSRSTLQHTLARLNQLTPASRTLAVIGTTHAPHAMSQLWGAADHVFRQPLSRGTGLAICVALAMIRRWSPRAVVTITPTDHYVDPNATYLERVRVARNVAVRMRDVIAILGARPTEPDPELGYLSVGNIVTDVPEARRLVEFVEKPTVVRAQVLIKAGALWNTMVMSGTVDAFWSLVGSVRPKLLDLLESLVPLVGTSDEPDALDYIYRGSPAFDFSRDFLMRAHDRVVAIEARGVEWSDWGRAERIETILATRRSRATM